MDERNESTILAIDEELLPKLSVNEAEALKPIQKQFMESYLAHKDAMSVEEWLHTEMTRSLPDRSTEEIAQMSEEIIATLKVQEEKKHLWKKPLQMDEAKSLGSQARLKKQRHS